MDRCLCGHQPGSADRFCARCGRPLDGGEPVFIEGAGAGGRPTPPSSTVQVSTGWSERWLLAVAVLGVLALALLVLRWPGTDETAGTTSESDESEEAATQAARSTTTAAAPSTTRAAAPIPESAGPPEELEGPSGPVVGEETGLALVVIDVEGARLVDLDTGIATDLDIGRHLRPLASMGRFLVYGAPGPAGSDGLFSLDVLAEGAEPVSLGPGVEGWTELIAYDVDRLLAWVVRWDEGPAPAVQAYSVVDGRLVEGEDFPTDGLYVGLGGEVGNNRVVSPVGGGVYQHQPDGSVRRVDDGFVVAQGRGVAAVRRCDEWLRCGTTWFELSPWRPFDQPGPDVDYRGWYRILGGDRWLFAGAFDGSARLVEVRTGRVAREWLAPFRDGPDAPIALSPDGRWLVDAAAEVDVAVLVDLDGGEVWPLDRWIASPSPRVALVELR